jgi:two-component system response regulator FixJ
VEVFESAADFLVHKSHVRPCCVLLDVVMLGLTGLDLQQTLARSGHGMPIVVMTGYHDVSMRETAMKQGAVDFLSKPFDIESLLGAIARAVTKDVKDMREPVKRQTPLETEVVALS